MELTELSVTKPLNIFYHDGFDNDRWFPFDRFPRAVIRRLIRGPRRILGHERLFLNLLAGLDKIGTPYRLNDYRYLRSHPDEVACGVGKPHILDWFGPKTPIIFGPVVYNHPIDVPPDARDLLESVRRSGRKAQPALTGTRGFNTMTGSPWSTWCNRCHA